VGAGVGAGAVSEAMVDMLIKEIKKP